MERHLQLVRLLANGVDRVAESNASEHGPCRLPPLRISSTCCGAPAPAVNAHRSGSSSVRRTPTGPITDAASVRADANSDARRCLSAERVVQKTVAVEVPMAARAIQSPGTHVDDTSGPEDEGGSLAGDAEHTAN